MLNGVIKILVAVIIGAAVLPFVSQAQTNINTSFSLQNELGVEITPSFPRPNETVLINLTLFTEDLNSADITWYKDGRTVLSGKGETKYSFTAGPAGTETKIEIRIKLFGGASFSKTFTLNPASVDLIWEANSYVPPFYKGKALHPMQGGLKVVAMPEFIKGGKRISPQNLIYKWSNGLNVYQSLSGYGKNVITIDGSLFGRDEEIKVLVTDPVSGLVAEGLLNVSPADPEIIFYENDPYYGHLFDIAIGSALSLKAEEVQILAAPYYFTEEESGVLKYEWRLNGQIIPNLSSSRTAIFRKPENSDGKSVISLRIENTNRILQQADGSLGVIFEK